MLSCTMYIWYARSHTHTHTHNTQHATQVKVVVEGWCRLKRGVYKGDVAQINDYDEGRAMLTCRLIPRIDVGAYADQRDKSFKRRRAKKVPARTHARTHAHIYTYIHIYV